MALLGIDIGSFNCLVSTIQGGHVVTIRNEISERATRASVGFADSLRLIGDEAQTAIFSNWMNTCINMKNFLGRLYTPNDLNEVMDLSLCRLTATDTGRLAYKVNYRGGDYTCDITAATAALLTKLVQIADKDTGKTHTEIVVACPGWYTDVNRAALLAATRIAGLTCLSIISEHVAVALEYGFFRLSSFKETEPARVAFVSIGHWNSSCCIVEFTVQDLRVISESFDNRLGGASVENVIVEHFAKLFHAKTGEQPLSHTKKRLKLQEQARKVKCILSANNDANFHVECLHEDYDCTGNITRDELNSMLEVSFIPQLKALLSKALATSGVNPSQIGSVEIIGGTTRVPIVQKVISEFFQKPNLSRTLSSDECVSRGAALQAAVRSRRHRLKQFPCRERVSFPISLRHVIKRDSSGEEYGEMCDVTQFGMEKLANYRPRFHVHDTMEIGAYYKSTEDLPTEATYCIGAVKLDIGSTSLENLKQPFYELVVGYDEFGLFRFKAAALGHTVIVQPNAKEEGESKSAEASSSPPEQAAGATKEDGASSKSNGSTLESSTEPTSPSPPVQKEPQRSIEYIPVKMVKFAGVGTYTDEQFEQLTSAECDMRKLDRLRIEKLDKMNEIETLIYSTREKLYSGAYQGYAVQGDQDVVLAAVDTMEAWMYENQNETLEIITSKLKELKDIIKNVESRIEDFENIREHLKNIIQIVMNLRNFIKKANDRKLFTEANILGFEAAAAEHKEWAQNMISVCDSRTYLEVTKLFTLEHVLERSSALNEIISTISGVLKKAAAAKPESSAPRQEGEGSASSTNGEASQSESGAEGAKAEAEASSENGVPKGEEKQANSTSSGESPNR